MKIGDRVKIIEGTQFYYQAPDIIGTVVDIKLYKNTAEKWVTVRWNDPRASRYIDNYPVEDLVSLEVKHEFPKEEFSEEQIALAEDIIRGS